MMNRDISKPTVFVSHADSSDVWALERCSDRSLSVLSKTELGGTLMPMALDSAHRLLHVVRRNAPLAVISLAVDASSNLQKVQELPLPASMAYLSIAPSGPWLFAASYQGGTVSSVQLGRDGLPRSIHQTIAIGPKAHAIEIHPNGRCVLATSLGSDQLIVFEFDKAKSQLERVSTYVCRPGSGPRHFRFHPRLNLVYVLHELDATIDVLAFDQSACSLSHRQTVDTMPERNVAEPWAADLHLSSDSGWLISSERRTSTLAVWKVDPNTGFLDEVRHYPTEATPRGIRIADDDRSVWVVGQDSHHLSNYDFCTDTGSLTLRQRLPLGQSPNWILAL